jgi:hypothetical protein
MPRVGFDKQTILTWGDQFHEGRFMPRNKYSLECCGLNLKEPARSLYKIQQVMYVRNMVYRTHLGKGALLQND